MNWTERARTELGDEPPLIADGRVGPPDRREVSARWLSGTFLTGLTSTILMGVALYGALEGRELLAIPPELLSGVSQASASTGVEKTGRVVSSVPVTRITDRRRMEVSTVTRDGNRDVVRMVPFQQVSIALAGGHTTSQSYPGFNPLAVFASDDADNDAAASTSLIYGARVESEVSFTTEDFPLEATAFDSAAELSLAEVENVVRLTGAALTDGDVRAAALHYVDPQRFGTDLLTDTLVARTGVRIIPENVSVAHRDLSGTSGEFTEYVIPVTKTVKIIDLLRDNGFEGEDAVGMADALSRIMSSESLREGSALRIGTESREDIATIMRISAYVDKEHVVTIAIDDHDQYVAAREPETDGNIIEAALDSKPKPVRVRGDLPSVYDGIYRAAFAYGLNETLSGRIIKMLAADVDFQSRLNPSDRMELLFSNPDENGNATDSSEILVLRANFNGIERNFYRFRTDDGSVDYYDETGKSARQFLLRNPVPTGKFRSGFGGRRHPILGYVKMHTGVDWSAPTGTPIISAGNGTVEKAGWAGGYGKQTIIRHANGYETSYNHQSRIAKGVTPGARVRQGQVIGYVGTTGLSTGPHLHYELIVNGNKVDPMRVRLPTGKVLKGTELAKFEAERDRIDAIMQPEDGESTLALARTDS